MTWWMDGGGGDDDGSRDGGVLSSHAGSCGNISRGASDAAAMIYAADRDNDDIPHYIDLRRV